MARIACLWVPNLSLAAHLRLDPGAAEMPLALVADRSTRSPVVTITPSAAAAGVAAGMTVARARAICAALVIRILSREAVTTALAVLADVAGTMSARVEIGDGKVFLDCEGSARLWESESELATVLAARAARQGLPAWVGIADSKLGASVAARESSGVRIIPSGCTRTFLAPLPLTWLEPTSEIAAVLSTWGIHRIGDLATLPTGALVHRLGPSGSRLVQWARGEDDEPLIGRQPPVTFDESLTLDYGIDRLEPLLFILRRMIEHVASRIDMQRLGCGALEVRLELEDGGCDLRTIPTAAPTVDYKTLLMLVRAHLEHRPPPSAVMGVGVVGMAGQVRPVQLDWLRPRGPDPSALAETLARLAALCGAEHVGTLTPVDSHRPDAVEVRTFATEEPSSRHAGVSARARTSTPTPPSPATTTVRVAIRAFRPPVELEVFETGGRLDYVRGDGFGGRVVHLGGPWRLRGEWWTDDPYAREYYDVELSDGGVYRLYRDLRTQRWLADGMYD